MEDIFRGGLYCGECGHKLSRMVTERKVSYKEVKHLYFIAARITNGLMKKNVQMNRLHFSDSENDPSSAEKRISFKQYR